MLFIPLLGSPVFKQVSLDIQTDSQFRSWLIFLFTHGVRYFVVLTLVLLGRFGRPQNLAAFALPWISNAFSLAGPVQVRVLSFAPILLILGRIWQVRPFWRTALRIGFKDALPTTIRIDIVDTLCAMHSAGERT